MTIADNTPRKAYVATAGQTAFPYPFEILAQTDLKVLKNGATLALSTHYTVSGVGNENGGTVTLVTGAAIGDEIVVYRDMPLSRTTDYQLGARLNPDTLDADLDRVLLGVQQVERDVGRALALSPADLFSPLEDLVLPDTQARISKFLAFDTAGKPIASPGSAAATAGSMIAIDDPAGYYAGGNVEQALSEIGTASRTFQSIALLKAGAARFDGEVVNVASYYASSTPDGGGGLFRWDAASASADNGGTIIAPDAGGTGRWKRIYSGALNVKWFGAKGDGVTNDTLAFQRASTLINAAGGGALHIPEGTYIVGGQDLAGATGLGYSYRAHSIIRISGCSRPVVIDGGGAKLKLSSGLRHGSYDPVTGLPNAPPLPNINLDFKASPGVFIHLSDNAGGVTVRDLEIDGSSANLVVGGQWGDTGYQVDAHAILALGNANLLLERIYAHDQGNDGFLIGYAGLTASSLATPTTMVNCTSEYNGRQGLSWVGGIGLTAINCKFNHTGRRVNAGTGVALVSAPTAGVDIEAEGSICRQGKFVNCEFINNTGIGMVADSGDSEDVAFDGCRFVGVTNWSLWPKKPGFSFTDCKIWGALANQVGSADLSLATKFTRCFFSDEAIAGYQPYVPSGISIFATALSAPVYYEKCKMVASRGKIGRLDTASLNECHLLLKAGTGFIADMDFAVVVNNAVLKNNRFESNILVNPPANGYFVQIDNTGGRFIGSNAMVNTAGIWRWQSWSTGAGGFIGNYGEREPAALGINGLSVYRRIRADGFSGSLVIVGHNVSPNIGTFNLGDVAINAEPALGAPTGWVCTAGGSPGTWVPLAPLDFSGSATYDPPSLADGAGATTTVAVTGAALGDFAEASFSLDLQGITLTAWVSAANTVSVRFQNETGGALDLASGTLRARVRKA